MKRRVYIWLFVLIAATVLALSSWFLIPPPQAKMHREQERSHAPVRPVGLGAYVNITDSPKITKIEDADFVCTIAGEETERAGKTETVEIDGVEFCKTVVSEGAAGSIFYQYAYVFSKEEQRLRLTFTVRMPQCVNYDSPQKEACMEQQEKFNPDNIVANIIGALN